MSKGSAPKAPDPVASAQAQAQANRITQITPQGNLIFGNLDKSGQFVPSTGGQQAASIIEQTPFQQQAQAGAEGGYTNLMQSLLPQAGNLQGINFDPSKIQSSIDFSQAGAIPGAGDFGAQTKQAQDAVYQSGMGLLQPTFDLQNRQIEQQLADKGLPVGSEAYNQEKDRIAREQGFQQNQLALNAVGAGNQQYQNLFQNALAGHAANASDLMTNASLNNQAEQLGLGQSQGVRANQLQELASLLGGSYNPTPGASFTPGGQVDITGPQNLAYQGQLNAYNQQQQQQAGLMNGLFGLGAAAMFL